MRREPPIAACTYGWGKEFRLYHDYLYAGGKRYMLNELTGIHPTYQHVLGISSVRLELHFGKKKVTLRGIAAIEEAQKAIDYLMLHYLGRGQGSFTSRTSEAGRWRWTREVQAPLEVSPQVQNWLPHYELATPQEPDARQQAQAQVTTLKLETPKWQRFRQEQRERRQRRLHTERVLREHGFDVERLAQQLKQETLPEVDVPIRLRIGERAHYMTDATLCGEPIGGELCSTYPARDHGMLILTNKRMVFLGRKSQVVLDYADLVVVYRLRGAVAFEAEHWQKREIFEVRRPLECTMYIDCILERWRKALMQRPQFRRITTNFFGDDVQSEEALGAVNIESILSLVRQRVNTSEVIDQYEWS